MANVVKTSEAQEQAALFEWAAYNEVNHPELRLLFAIPNGDLRHPVVARRLRATGTKAGVPDIFLPVARHGYYGLFIELKVGHNRLSEKQSEWICALRYQRYEVEICRNGWNAAADIILRYLGSKED